MRCTTPRARSFVGFGSWPTGFCQSSRSAGFLRGDGKLGGFVGFVSFVSRVQQRTMRSRQADTR